MIDIKWIRENKEALDKNQVKRGSNAIAVKLLDVDSQKRSILVKLQELQQKRNNISKQLASIDKNSQAFQDAKSEVQNINDEINSLKEKSLCIESEFDAIYHAIPNILDDIVPSGKDEEDNVVKNKWGEIPNFDFKPLPHEQVGEKLGMIDFTQTAKISGSRFVTLKRDLSKLERALANFMIDVHTREFGYEEISPPLLVSSKAMFGTGQLPKFAEDSFVTTDEKWLVSTSEIPITNMAREQIISIDALPLRYTAHTPCFRSEAGSAGRDTKGIIRLHQFNKVELVTICTEEQAEKEFENMCAASIQILKLLELPFQEVLLCSGDTGFSARKTLDLEVWLPSQNCYREISSRSYFGDFQARRMNARYREDSEKQTSFVHTMNGSGLAVGRTIVAILENYQQKDGSVIVPKVLVPYMNGQDRIK